MNCYTASLHFYVPYVSIVRTHADTSFAVSCALLWASYVRMRTHHVNSWIIRKTTPIHTYTTDKHNQQYTPHYAALKFWL